MIWAGEKTIPRGCDHKPRPLEVAEAPISEVQALHEADDVEIEIMGHPLTAIAAARGRNRNTTVKWNYYTKIRIY